MTSPRTVRCISVTSSGRSSISSTIRCTSGWLVDDRLAMFCIITVLPALGGDTIRPRWPLPIGAIRSMMRPVMSSELPLPRSSRNVAREQRRQVLEQHLALGRLRRFAVDGVDHRQREVALAVLGPADAAGDFVAGAQVEAADLAGRDVDVVGAGQVAGIVRAQEAEAVGQDFQHAVAGHALRWRVSTLSRAKMTSCLRMRATPSAAQLFGDLEQLVSRHALEVVEAVDREVLGDLGRRRASGRRRCCLRRRATTTAAAFAALEAVALVAEAVAAIAAAFAAAVAACPPAGRRALSSFSPWPPRRPRCHPGRRHRPPLVACRRHDSTTGFRGRRRRAPEGAAGTGTGAAQARGESAAGSFLGAAARGLRGRFSALAPESVSFSDTDSLANASVWRKGVKQEFGARRRNGL